MQIGTATSLRSSVFPGSTPGGGTIDGSWRSWLKRMRLKISHLKRHPGFDSQTADQNTILICKLSQRIIILYTR